MIVSECDWFHEKTLVAVEWAAALALELSMKASPGRWEAVPCAGANESNGPFVVRILDEDGDSSKLTRDDAQFIAQARHGLPSFAAAIRSLVAEVRRLQSGKGYEDLLAAVERLTRERNVLGGAIADAAKRAGVYNGEVALTGPDLVLLAQNMADEIVRLRAACAASHASQRPAAGGGR
ncbi:hypothetical protein [Sorangium sp. So ce388]|uniref:hypothetical protein n=1 Tax=Sorangium sp. So ce388 TaxID=3133309 RepID=UPI003F5BBEC3